MSLAFDNRILWCVNSHGENGMFDQGPEIYIKKGDIMSFTPDQLVIAPNNGSNMNTQFVSFAIYPNDLEISYDPIKPAFLFIFGKGLLKVSSSSVYTTSGSLISFKSNEIEIDGDALFPKMMAKNNGKYVGGTCILDTELLPKQ